MTPPHFTPSCSDPNDLRCRKVDCPSDTSPSTTTVSGVVYDPAGRVPLYNVVVFVPSDEQLKPLGTRVECESCGAHFPETALAVALTKSDGSFTITDVPAGPNVPLIIQIGKWRRLVHIPNVVPCTTTQLPKELTRLPKSSREGDLPKIAVATGKSDLLECLVKKIGIDLSEFSSDRGTGRVNLFSGFGAATTMQIGSQSEPLTPAENLWSNLEKMKEYDMLLMSCEGDDNLWQDPPISGNAPRTAAMHGAVREYANQGGRIFGSHWHHRWINSNNERPDVPYPAVATFAEKASDLGDQPVTVTVDASFPKGLAFQEWLFNVGASTKLGELTVSKAEHSVDSVNDVLAQRWIYGADPAPDPDNGRSEQMVQYFSFTTPVAQQECGRMVFSDVHVSFGNDPRSLDPFPMRCDPSANDELSPQEKALAFMIFDLSSCIQKEEDEVRSPIPVVK